MKLLFIFLLGTGILIGALILNFIASKLGLSNWYDFLKKPGDAPALSLIWLFIVYPFGLGLTAYFLNKVL